MTTTLFEHWIRLREESVRQGGLTGKKIGRSRAPRAAETLGILTENTSTSGHGWMVVRTSDNDQATGPSCSAST